MLVGHPYDRIKRAQGADALWGTEELLFIGKPEFELCDGETAFGRCFGRTEVELFVVVFVAPTEVEISLEVLGKSG